LRWSTAAVYAHCRACLQLPTLLTGNKAQLRTHPGEPARKRMLSTGHCSPVCCCVLNAERLLHQTTKASEFCHLFDFRVAAAANLPAPE
jgi:hypothetical protein